MDLREWYSAVLQYLILLPSAVSCYLPAKNHLKYSVRKTAVLCLGLMVPYIFAAAWADKAFHLLPNDLFLPALPLLFLLYRRTVDLDLPRTLAVYVGVCALQTFPNHIANTFDVYFDSAAWETGFLTGRAILIQMGLACLMAASACTVRRQIWWVIDHLDSVKIWYSTVAISGMFLILNVAAAPQSSEVYQAGQPFHLFLLLQICLLILLVCVYVLFYQGARLMLERAQLEQRTQLLEMQSHQYQALQEHMRQTARLRHDFRHSLRLLSTLAEQEDLAGVRSHLAEYERTLTEKAPAAYCANTVLNALFGYYEEMAASAQIKIDWRIQLPDPLTVSELDLASLFGNLLENGINGCQTLPDVKRRFSLTTELRQGSSLYIVSTNSFDGHVRKGKNGYYSTRHDGRGIGLVSIAAIVEKYNGSVRFSNSDTEFFVDVVLNV